LLGANRVIQGSQSRGSNLDVSISPTGTTEISNAPKTGTIPSPSVGGTAPTQDSMSYQKFAETRNNISATEDPLERGTKVAELIGSVQAHISKIYGEVAKTAEAMYGIPELEKNLSQAISEDKADPMYAKFLSDSPITAKIRTDLEQARSQAVGKSKT